MCKNLSFADCELAILHASVDKIEKRVGEKLVHSPTMSNVIQMVEHFIKTNKCIIYGGTAINNILPEKDQFYDYDYQLPDYDFFCTEPLKLATELADLFAKKGYEVEAKSGVHHGTFKVFVDRLGVADITYLHPEIYKMLLKSAIVKKGLLYAPANFLRQSMYLELSRPLGDVSRWEKVLKRLNALNKHYPLVYKKCTVQRKMSNRRHEDKLFQTIKHFFIDQNVVFIGGYANSLYTQHTRIPRLANLPDFDVLVNDPKDTAQELVKVLKADGYDATLKEHEAIGELISTHYSVSVEKDYVAFLYEPVACHSYNEIQDGHKKIKVGTIDTLLSYYLAFMYADRDYFDENRLLCLSGALFRVQQENRLAQKGLLKRFGMNCYGVQPTLKSIMDEKSKLYETLDHNSAEFKERFFKYTPKRQTPKTRKNKLK
jgi:hypothetical protein